MKEILKLTFLFLFFCKNSFAINLIRDFQTENFLYRVSNPIFQAANLDKKVKIFIVNDPGINAFVAGGKNIFINTGTILLDRDPLGLLGVIAHETGHIYGSHLARQSIDLGSLNKQMALGFILGIALAFSDNPDAGQAVILGSSHIAERNFYKFTSAHEKAADEAALQFLNQTGLSSKGLVDFFSHLKTNEKLIFNQDDIDPYTVTHPLTKNRVERVKMAFKKDRNKGKNISLKDKKEFNIIQAKIEAFLGDPKSILDIYQENKDADNIARAIAYHKLGNLEKSLFYIAKLKNNIFNQELKAQILYEAGKAEQAYVIFKDIKDEVENSNYYNKSLIYEEYATIALAANKKDSYENIIILLEQSLEQNKNNYRGWLLLGNLYNNVKKKSLSFLALSEANLAIGRLEKAKKYAKKAKELLDKNKESNIQLEDILEEIKKIEEKK